MLMPSTMVAHGPGMVSAEATFLSSSLANADLFVFLKETSGVAKDHGKAPEDGSGHPSY